MGEIQSVRSPSEILCRLPVGNERITSLHMSGALTKASLFGRSKPVISNEPPCARYCLLSDTYYLMFII